MKKMTKKALIIVIGFLWHLSLQLLCRRRRWWDLTKRSMKTICPRTEHIALLFIDHCQCKDDSLPDQRQQRCLCKLVSFEISFAFPCLCCFCFFSVSFWLFDLTNQASCSWNDVLKNAFSRIWKSSFFKFLNISQKLLEKNIHARTHTSFFEEKVLTSPRSEKVRSPSQSKRKS